jgi:hypothetical protein
MDHPSYIHSFIHKNIENSVSQTHLHIVIFSFIYFSTFLILILQNRHMPCGLQREFGVGVDAGEELPEVEKV